jgi:hypothetical protein
MPQGPGVPAKQPYEPKSLYLSHPSGRSGKCRLTGERSVGQGREVVSGANVAFARKPARRLRTRSASGVHTSQRRRTRTLPAKGNTHRSRAQEEISSGDVARGYTAVSRRGLRRARTTASRLVRACARPLNRYDR